jgi:serine/threonine-protein kinase
VTVTDQRDDIAAALARRYALDDEIGHGGMATVYRARTVPQGVTVAIKVLRPELAVAVAAERFAREVRVTQALEHRYILPLIDSGEDGGFKYYVMPYVETASLAERVARGPLPVAEAVRFASQVADALAFAHARGLIHRDIKPANILVSDDQVLLADFGLARIVDSGASEVLTDSGLALGTASYMSPEQAAGERVDARTDVYALGCVLYELLSGTPPFTGASQRDIMARHATDPVPSVRTVRREVPVALEAAIVRALAKDPADRWSDAAAFGAAMRASLVSEGKSPIGTSASTPRTAIVAVIATLIVALVGLVIARMRG